MFIKFKLISFIAFLLFGFNILNSECLIKMKIENEGSLFPGSMIILKQVNEYPLSENLDIIIDNNILIKTFELKNRTLKFFLPNFLPEGIHKLFIKEKLFEDCAELNFNVIKKETKSTDIDPYNPDANTNLGRETDYSKNKKVVTNRTTVTNKPGGSTSINIQDCDKFHVIDGKFTDSVGYGTTKEWSTITPLIGTFSNLYLDYCPKTKVLYIMNDWKLGNGNYDSLTCYNEFEFSTAGGSENWKVKIYNSITKGIVVTLNGKDVSNDTNYVLAGRYGYDKSLLIDSNHTLWEFGVKASGGLFVMRLYRDEVGMIEIKPNVKLICDDNGYGTIPEPNILTGYLGGKENQLYISDRYIPINGVAGLVTEPYSFGGYFVKDTSVIYSTKDHKKIVNICKNNHKIDGKFTNEIGAENEWENSTPAQGMFSNLYAEFCNGKLYILNDWKLANEEPDKQNCYNLFELYTGNGKEHWGIYVFHDNTKKPLVFRNGVDVSNDTSIVEDGKYGFGKSPGVDYEHTIYEFAINASEGEWHLFLCDPGPSSFCDSDSKLPRKFSEKIFIKSSQSNQDVNVINTYYNDTLQINISYDDFDNIYGNKFKFLINYDYKLFYPLLERITELNKGKFDLLEVKKVTNGLLEIEGFSENLKFDNQNLIILEGIVLAGYSNKSTLSGNVLIGNKARYMREYDIQPIEIVADSKCPITKNFVVDNALSIISFYPNPTESFIQVELIAKYETLANIEILNYFGKTEKIIYDHKFTGGINEMNLNLSDLKPGIYLLLIKNGIDACFYKFIKR